MLKKSNIIIHIIYKFSTYLNEVLYVSNNRLLLPIHTGKCTGATPFFTGPSNGRFRQ